MQHLDDLTGERIPEHLQQRQSQRDWMFGQIVGISAVLADQIQAKREAEARVDALALELATIQRRYISLELVETMVRQARQDATDRHEAFVSRSFMARLKWLVTGA